MKRVKPQFTKYVDQVNKLIGGMTEDQSSLLKNGAGSPITIADEIREIERIKDSLRETITYIQESFSS